MKSKARNIGLDVKAPTKVCHDKNCPFHGSIKTHGRIFTGVVISDKAQKTVTVEMQRQVYFKKYERYGKDRTVIHAHNPECIDAAKGDIVKIIETRPISKIKNFVVIEKVGHKEDIQERDYASIEKKKESEKKVEENESS